MSRDAPAEDGRGGRGEETAVGEEEESGIHPRAAFKRSVLTIQGFPARRREKVLGPEANTLYGPS